MKYAFAQRLPRIGKDTVYTFTLSIPAEFLTYTAYFVIILRRELPRTIHAGRNTGSGEFDRS